MAKLEYPGHNGLIKVVADHLVIEHKGLGARAAGLNVGQAQWIPLKDLSDVWMREPTPWVNGGITLGLRGEPAPERSVYAMASDPLAVIFARKDKGALQELYSYLAEVAKENRKTASATREVPVADEDEPDVEDYVERQQDEQSVTVPESESESDLYGRVIEDLMFGNRVIKIYDKGYVKVHFPLLGSKAAVQRLVSIDSSAHVSKKTGIGRGVGAVATGGLNMLMSNKRGDVYLTVRTSERVYVLHEEPPTRMNLKTAQRLEAAGSMAIQNSQTQGANPQVSDQAQDAPVRTQDASIEGQSMASRLRELQVMRDEGLISSGEYETMRERVLGQF